MRSIRRISPVALILALLPVSGPCQCDDAWGTFATGGQWQVAVAMAVDEAGQVIQVGGCLGQSSFGNVTVNAPQETVYVTKYDTQGDVSWVGLATGTASLETECVTTDGQGNIYIGGSYRGEASFGGINLPAATGGSSASLGGFVAKYAPDGDPLWVRPWNASGGMRISGLDVDPVTGELLVGGDYGDTAAFGISDAIDLVILRLDADGALLHATTITRPGNQRVRDLVLGPDGEVYIAGLLDGEPLSVPNGVLVPAASLDALLLRVDADTITWGQRAGGANSDQFAWVHAGAPGQVCVPLYMIGDADIGGTPLPSAGNLDLGMAVFDSATGELLWVWHAGGPEHDFTRNVCYDALHNVYHASGTFFDTIEIGGVPVEGNAQEGNSVLLTFDTEGALLSTHLLNDQVACTVNDLVTDHTGTTFMVGEVTGAAGTLAGWSTAPTGLNAFALKWCDPVLSVSMPRTDAGITVHPIPVRAGDPVHITWNDSAQVMDLLVFDACGRVVRTLRSSYTNIAIPTAHLSVGVYTVMARSDDRCLDRLRFVVQ